jgi:flavin-dependent dehydrogenase
MSLNGTLDLDDARHHDWDVVVIGAGVAGALAAREIVRLGRRVLLVDQSAFPRQKTCGDCLNEAALAVLARVGLAELPRRLGGRAIERLRLAYGGMSAELPLATGIAVSRSALDAALVEAAVAAGADFLPESAAQLGETGPESRSVVLRQKECSASVQARVVIVAAGLGNACIARSEEFVSRRSRHTRVGAGAVTTTFPAHYAPGAIYMSVGRRGYVGAVRIEEGGLNLAGAFDPEVLHGRSPAAAVEEILREAGAPPIPNLDGLSWKGTPPLTCRTFPLAAERVFLVGDAAGYVEPFTGEGMAWALAGGAAIAPLAARAVANWHPVMVREWSRLFRRIVLRRQWICRGLAVVVRSRWMSMGAMRMCAWSPRLAAPFVRWINQPGFAG